MRYAVLHIEKVSASDSGMSAHMSEPSLRRMRMQTARTFMGK